MKFHHIMDNNGQENLTFLASSSSANESSDRENTVVISASENSETTNRQNFKNLFKFPKYSIFNWLPFYKKSYFFSDLIAGITVGIVHIPQAQRWKTPHELLFFKFESIFKFIDLTNRIQ